MFEKFKVYTSTELASRTEILLENYSKVINIEALTMIDMTRKQILPAVMKYTKDICDVVASKKAAGLAGGAEEKLASRLASMTSSLDNAVEVLENKLIETKTIEDVEELAKYYRNEVFVAMQSLRAVADELETIVSSDVWPFPVYSDMLFKI